MLFLYGLMDIAPKNWRRKHKKLGRRALAGRWLLLMPIMEMLYLLKHVRVIHLLQHEQRYMAELLNTEGTTDYFIRGTTPLCREKPYSLRVDGKYG